MAALELDVNYPEQCVESLKKLQKMLFDQKDGFDTVLQDVFALASTDEPDILHELLHLTKKALKPYSQLYLRAAELLELVISNGKCKPATYPIIVDLFLAIIYCSPEPADIIIDASLPRGCQAIFPVDMFNRLLCSFLKEIVPKALVHCLTIRVLQFKDVYFHSLAFICQYSEFKAVPSRQLIQFAVALLLHESALPASYLPDTAEFLAVPVGSSFKLEIYMRQVDRGVEAADSLNEPAQKPATGGVINTQDAMERRTRLKELNNQKFREREFECFYQLPYGDYEFIKELKMRFVKHFMDNFQLFYSHSSEYALQLLETAEHFDMSACLDALQQVYDDFPAARLLVLRLLIGVQRSDKYVHNVFAKIYDNIVSAALNDERNESAMFKILAQLVQNQHVELMMKATLLCKLASCLPCLSAPAAFKAVLVLLSAVLRNPRMRSFISSDLDSAICAGDVVRARDFAGALGFISAHFPEINLLELGLLRTSVFAPLFDYLERLSTGECLENDLDLPEFIDLRLSQAIASSAEERVSSCAPDGDIVCVQRKLFEAASSVFAADFTSEITVPLREYLAQKVASAQGSDLLASASLKHAKLGLQKQLEAELSRAFVWRSGDVETQVAQKRVVAEQEEPAEESWGEAYEEANEE